MENTKISVYIKIKTHILCQTYRLFTNKLNILLLL